jgi:hypothetical protein
MRPCGPSKQRLWLGTRQYRSGCRSATTNADATSAYANTYGDAMRAWNTYAYAHSDGNSDGYRNCNAYSERNSDADTYIYGHANGLAYSYAQGDTEGSPDTASAADSVVG